MLDGTFTACRYRIKHTSHHDKDTIILAHKQKDTGLIANNNAKDTAKF